MQRVFLLGFVERRNLYRPAQGEAPFEAEEMFFSRTDDRGIILSGNYVFQRVAHYSWDELLGAPHKLIRHPDTPKGVFWLFWDTLKKGQPIGAYVKNKARDGLYYWVFAVAMPFAGGYLSVRIKPSSDLFTIIKTEYAALREAELEMGVGAEDSAAALLQRINELGYASYEAFASEALVRELSARDSKMGRPEDASDAPFAEMIKSANELHDLTQKFSQDFAAISTVPTNMRIIAARLEPSGGAISSLSQNYWEMSEEMSRWFQTYVSGENSKFSAIRSTLENSHFLFGLSRILSSVATQFSMERRALGNLDVHSEKNQMNTLSKQYVEKAVSGLNKVVSEAQRISNAIQVMRRYTLGLSTTRVMCNIESARLPSGGGSLVDVINQLGAFQEVLDRQLEKIEGLSHVIQDHAECLISKRAVPETQP